MDSGNEHFWVGHEAALGMGDVDGGQCVVNPLVGEWYSLPEGGKCTGGAMPGDGSCTWKATRERPPREPRLSCLAPVDLITPMEPRIVRGRRLAHTRTPVAARAGVKTIDAQCLFKHGFLAACKADTRAPFTTAQKTFLNAFASTDPTKGGCPALPGPTDA